jgi:hypothetical protein
VALASQGQAADRDAPGPNELNLITTVTSVPCVPGSLTLNRPDEKPAITATVVHDDRRQGRTWTFQLGPMASLNNAHIGISQPAEQLGRLHMATLMRSSAFVVGEPGEPMANPLFRVTSL